MKNNSFLLFKTMVMTTSRWYTFRHCNDPSKRKKIIGETVAYVILGVFFFVVCMLLGISYGEQGMADLLPALSTLAVSLVTFFFTVFKTNGYLFKFKEYDMLMSLPFKAKTIAGCKFLYMYLTGLLWDVVISAGLLIGYGIYVDPPVWVYPLWIVLGAVVPLVPMLLASFLGFLIAAVSSGFRKKNLIQVVLIFLVTLLGIAFRVYVDAVMDDEMMDEILLNLSVYVEKITDIYLPAKWFAEAVCKGSISAALLLMGVSIALFEVVFVIVGRSYREINSKLNSHAAAKKFKMKEQKVRNLWNAIAFKEFKRMTGSVIYITNVAMGEVIITVASVAVCFIKVDTFLKPLTESFNTGLNMFYPAIPLAIYFLLGLAATTVMSPSLEGKNYWIVQSLPIDTKDLYKGKMLFNLYLTVPFMILGTLSLGIAVRMPFITILLSLILGALLLAFSSAWGCVCGVKHINLNWENETQVVKQGPAVMIYMIPNELITIALTAVVTLMGIKINADLILIVLILIAAGLATLSYKRVLSLAEESR
ncbi:MAG: hypothetical protein K6F63_05465 [Lachnospiraceae bacterium]|nr:hypothetical protein [Lachnospiraceae bacterium]